MCGVFLDCAGLFPLSIMFMSNNFCSIVFACILLFTLCWTVLTRVMDIFRLPWLVLDVAGCYYIILDGAWWSWILLSNISLLMVFGLCSLLLDSIVNCFLVTELVLRCLAWDFSASLNFCVLFDITLSQVACSELWLSNFWFLYFFRFLSTK